MQLRHAHAREHPLAALPAVAHRELAGVHLAIDGSRVNKETFCAAENSKFGLTPIIDYDVRHLDLLTSLVESNNCVSIVPAVKYKELSLQATPRPGVPGVCRRRAHRLLGHRL